MARRRSGERTVFLPWERQGGVLGRLGLARARLAGALLALLVLLSGLLLRERHRAGLRSTRATILAGRRAVDDFRADHNGGCPKGGLEELVGAGYLSIVPRDAWNHPLRLVCPSRRADRPYDLLSDGPDGEPGGLDRVE